MNDGAPKILPPNAYPLERHIDAVGEDRLNLIKVRIRHLWDATTCPANWLPVLAWSLGVDSWRSDWPEATKRAVIAATPTVKRLKGTVGAVRRAVQAVAGHAPVTIVDWFAPDGSGVPLTARVEIDITSGSGERLIGDASRAGSAAKRESVHLDFRLKARPKTHLVAASHLGSPLVHVLQTGSARYVPTLSAGLAVGALASHPVTVAHVSMEGEAVRPFSAGLTAALHLRPITFARIPTGATL